MIYYVEDDENIRDLALYALSAQGLEARGFASAVEFKQAFMENVPDLVLLDIMLPGEDGLCLLQWIREDSPLKHVPVMMLTAKGTEYDKVRGLDMGADDYLAKPFGVMELISRCKALIRRSSFVHDWESQQGGGVVIGPLALSPDSHRVFCAGSELELTLKEFDLLKKLMESPGRAFSRSQLMEDVWGTTFIGETRTVDTHVQTLRRKLNEADSGAGNLIETVRGVGYRMAVEE